MESGTRYQESALIQAFSQGSMAAFDTLYLKYFDALLVHTRELTKDNAAAQDIVQDLFLRMWERREQFSKYEKLSGWLFVCSYHEAISYLRKLGVQRRLQQDLRHLSQPIDPTIFSRHEAQFDLMEKAIEQLPPVRRKVFELCKYQGLSYEEAASVLSISKNTVKEHLVKASAFIRAYVRDSPDHALMMSALLLLHAMLD